MRYVIDNSVIVVFDKNKSKIVNFQAQVAAAAKMDDTLIDDSSFGNLIFRHVTDTTATNTDRSTATQWQRRIMDALNNLPYEYHERIAYVMTDSTCYELVWAKSGLLQQ